jgi:hypothetical protein
MPLTGVAAGPACGLPDFARRAFFASRFSS